MKLTNWLKPVHRAFRETKIRMFIEKIRPVSSDTLLDIGGSTGITGEFLGLYSYFNKIVILNLRPVNPIVEIDTKSDLILADGCFMPFLSYSFDFVFSNAVIEHVGPWQRQKMLADEIRRVAKKGYFIATPNRYFPIEPHTLLPFYQFMPATLQKAILKISPGYLTKYEPINLLSARELQTLFPEAKVVKIGFPIIRNNLVAFWKKG